MPLEISVGDLYESRKGSDAGKVFIALETGANWITLRPTRANGSKILGREGALRHVSRAGLLRRYRRVSG